jgi:hypothetical protein
MYSTEKLLRINRHEYALYGFGDSFPLKSRYFRSTESTYNYYQKSIESRPGREQSLRKERCHGLKRTAFAWPAFILEIKAKSLFYRSIRRFFEVAADS